jgi:hypothetical protein
LQTAGGRRNDKRIRKKWGVGGSAYEGDDRVAFSRKARRIIEAL